MSIGFAQVLAGVTRQRGVLGAIIASEGDGLVVDATVHQGVPTPVIAALGASLYRRARLAGHAAHIGSVAFLQLEAEQGRLCAVGRNDLVLVALTDPTANVGLLRVEMLRAVESLG